MLNYTHNHSINIINYEIKKFFIKAIWQQIFLLLALVKKAQHVQTIFKNGIIF